MKYLNIKKALEAWQELQPLSERDKERLSRRFTVDFNYNSNHIEGNTLTYGQTEIHFAQAQCRDCHCHAC